MTDSHNRTCKREIKQYIVRVNRENMPQPSQLKSSTALIQAKAIIHQTHNHTLSFSEGGTVNTFVASTHAGRWRRWVSWVWVGDGLKTERRTGNWGCPMISLRYFTMRNDSTSLQDNQTQSAVSETKIMLKGSVHPKVKILLSFTHHFFLMQHKNKMILMLATKLFWWAMTSIVWPKNV